MYNLYKHKKYNIMEKSEIRLEAIKALKDDKGVKAWLIPNELLFTESMENGDMFLTSYRIRIS